MDWPWSGLKKKMVETTKTINEAAGSTEVAPADAAKEKQYNDEIKATHLRMGYGMITKEQHDEQINTINKKYGKAQ